MIGYVIGFMMVDFVIMIILQVDTPLFYKVRVVSTTPYGFTTESRGECTADSGIWMWLALSIALHAALLAYGNVLVYQLRNVPSEFNEGKFVGFSLANNLQTGVLALMLLLLISDSPTVSFLVKWFTVYWTSTLTLIVMFVPKIQQVHFKREDEDDIKLANEVRKAEKKRSRLATLKRQASRMPVFRTSIGARNSCSEEVSTKSRKNLLASSAGRSAVLPSDLNIGVTAAESAATLAKGLIDCLKKGTTVGEWLASIVPNVRLLSPTNAPEEHADTLAHLVIEGQHLRSLRARTERRASTMLAGGATGVTTRYIACNAVAPEAAAPDIAPNHAGDKVHPYDNPPAHVIVAGIEGVEA